MKYNDNGEYKDIYVKAFDTLPVGTEVDYNGSTVPSGWTAITDPNEYSTTEKVIGKWINGKPLYRKVINVNMPNNQIRETTHNIANINIITKIDGFTISSDNSTFTPINSPNVGAIANSIQTWADKTKIYVRSGVDISSFTGCVILEYTKTTD